ncbi:MAG: TauD/TfdA family dioxygenase [Alphaproteobacteria bacterium]|nr:TauD/TfdA family dioxygenase [Alphaproteobacteria bacterium]
MIDVRPIGNSWAAEVRGIDLSEPLNDGTIAALRAAWLAHHVLAFPDQRMNDDELERFTLCFGPFGEDPFIAPIAGREHVIAVERRADETGPVFAEAWHTDWSFLSTPPAGTCLYGVVIPPIGGDTLFANQHLALDRMPDGLRQRLEGRRAVHSARAGYARDGAYGEADRKTRSMDIRPSDDAMKTHAHPIVRRHPETGREGVFGCAGYVIGFEDMDPIESTMLLGELYQHQTKTEFQYRHKWSPGMLVMWDNRSVLHSATGGYEGHARRMHRTTIGERG